MLGNKENWTMPVINLIKVISVVVSDCRQQESSSVSLSFSFSLPFGKRLKLGKFTQSFVIGIDEGRSVIHASHSVSLSSLSLSSWLVFIPIVVVISITATCNFDKPPSALIVDTCDCVIGQQPLQAPFPNPVR